MGKPICLGNTDPTGLFPLQHEFWSHLHLLGKFILADAQSLSRPSQHVGLQRYLQASAAHGVCSLSRERIRILVHYLIQLVGVIWQVVRRLTPLSLPVTTTAIKQGRWDGQEGTENQVEGENGSKKDGGSRDIRSGTKGRTRKIKKSRGATSLLEFLGQDFFRLFPAVLYQVLFDPRIFQSQDRGGE